MSQVRFTLIAAAATLAPSLGCAGRETEFTHCESPVIELPDGAVRLMPSAAALDSPVLSPDGNRLAVQLEVYEDPVLPYEIYSLAVAERDVSGRWSALDLIQHGVYKKYTGRMEMPIQPGRLPVPFDTAVVVSEVNLHTPRACLGPHLQFDVALALCDRDRHVKCSNGLLVVSRIAKMRAAVREQTSVLVRVRLDQIEGPGDQIGNTCL